MKAYQLFATTAVVVALAGCSAGQDPAKNYADAKTKATTAADPSAKPVDMTPPPAPKQPDNTQSICGQVFDASIVSGKSKDLMAFNENTEGSYQISVRSFFGPTFTVDTENLNPTLAADFHAGRAKFTKVSQSGSTATYSFTWKPAALSTANPEFQTLTLKFTSAAAAQCGNDISSTMNLVLDPQAVAQGASK